MSVEINFEDNLFYLSSHIDLIKNGIELNLDNSLYTDHMVEHILFIDSTLKALISKLRHNPHMLNRSEYLRILAIGQRQFIDLLDYISSHKEGFSTNLQVFNARFKNIINDQQQEVDNISDQLKEKTGPIEDEKMISNEEYRFLFQPGEEEEE